MMSTRPRVAAHGTEVRHADWRRDQNQSRLERPLTAHFQSVVSSMPFPNHALDDSIAPLTIVGVRICGSSFAGA